MREVHIENSAIANGSFILALMPFVVNTVPFVKPPVANNLPSVIPIPVRAFTLIELLVTLTVIGILVLTMTPGLRGFSGANQLAGITNDYVHDLSLARSEALKQGRGAGVCPSTDGSGCITAGDWTNGWLVFADLDDTKNWTASDAAIRFHRGLSGISITGSSDLVLYNRYGYTTAANYRVCSTTLRQSRTVSINATGHHRVVEGPC